MVNGVHRSSALQLPDYTAKQWSFSLPVILDSVPLTRHFGDISCDRKKDCYVPGDAVEIEFWFVSWCPLLFGFHFVYVGRRIQETVFDTQIIRF